MSDSTRRELLFEVRGHLCSADIRDVRGVTELADVTPVPGSITGVLGLINLHGAIVVAGDLGSLLGLGASDGEEAALVVVELGVRCAALRVDRVVSVEAGEDGSEDDMDWRVPGALEAANVVTGVGRFDSRPVYRLDPDAILSRVLAGPGQRPDPIRAREGCENNESHGTDRR